jgi:hypothetical protein
MYPSKPTLIDVRKQIIDVNDMQQVFRTCRDHFSIARYIVDHQQTQQIERQYKSFVQELSKSAKPLLAEKIRQRYVGDQYIPHVVPEGESLFSLYQHIMGSCDSSNVVLDETLTNPVTNSIVTIHTSKKKHSTIKVSILDAMRYAFEKDKYFGRMLYQRVILLTDDASTTTNHLKDSIDAIKELATKNDRRVLIITTTVLPSEVKEDPLCDCYSVGNQKITLDHLQLMLPRLASQCLIVTDHTHAKLSKCRCHPLTLDKRNTWLFDTGRLTLMNVSKMNPECHDCHDCHEYPLHVLNLTCPIMRHTMQASDIMSTVVSTFVHYIDKKRQLGLISSAKSINSHFKGQDCVVLIDNRANILSVMACLITFSNLAKDHPWCLVIYTSNKAMLYYKHHFDENNVRILASDKLDKDKFDIEDYNNFLKDKSMWCQLHEWGFQNAMIIQDDGFPIRHGIEKEFLGKYDYVGAPWSDTPVNEALKTIANPMLVGNGGYSLRNVAIMMAITMDPICADSKNHLFNNDLQPIPEDVFFAGECHKRGARVPSTEIATLFSSEQILNANTMGIHKPWAYFPHVTIKSFFENLLDSIT